MTDDLLLPGARLSNLEPKNTGVRWYQPQPRKNPPCIFCGKPGCHAKCMEERAKVFFENPRLPVKGGVSTNKRAEKTAQDFVNSSPKHCKFCGALLVRRRYSSGSLESFVAFSGRKFCNHQCSSQYRCKEEIGDKYCRFCGKLMTPQSNEYPSRFIRRKYCNNKCAALAMHRAKRGKR